MIPGIVASTLSGEGPAIYPAVRDVQVFGEGGSTNTTFTCNFTAEIGDIIIAMLGWQGAQDFATPSGWARLFLTQNGSTIRAIAEYKVATVAGAQSVTYTTAGAIYACGQVIVIKAGTYSDIPKVASAIYVGTTPDCPSTPAIGSAKSLVIAGYAARSTDTTPSSYPYPNPVSVSTASSSVMMSMYTCRKDNDNDPENPPAFGAMIESKACIVFTIAIRR